jgi:hypothetical protein
MKKKKKVKFKIGQLVYSYQNKTKKHPINRIMESDDSQYEHKYRLSLPSGNSNWISESSLYLTKKK